jgi:hypothetical protein
MEQQWNDIDREKKPKDSEKNLSQISRGLRSVIYN